MLPLVSPDWQKLAQARIACRRDAEGLQYAIDQVPPALRDDPGLAYERYLYRVGKGKLAGRRGLPAGEVALGEGARAGPSSGWSGGRTWRGRRSRTATSGRPTSSRRATSARRAADYADAEWVAGFIALTRMDDPKTAIAHFVRFRAAVATPISLGRAGYWLGLAYTRAGDAAAAAEAFAMAAQYQTSFYGQLAAEKVASPPDAGARRAAGRRRTGGMRRSCRPRWCRRPTGCISPTTSRRASQFWRQAAEGQPAATRAALAQMAIDLGRPQIGIRIAKDAAARG